MSFQFETKDDQIVFASMKRIVQNDGVFEKTGQAYKFFTNPTAAWSSMEGVTAQNAMDFFGIEIDLDTQVLLFASAITCWADYGSRSKVPVLWGFVLDQYGLVRKYKVGGSGNLAQGWAPNPAKTKVEFERGDVEIPQWLINYNTPAEAEEPAEETRPVMQEGRRVITGVIKSVRVLDGFYGSQVKMLVEDDEGNRVFGTMPSGLCVDRDLTDREGNVVGSTTDMAQEGDRVQVTATVQVKEDGHFGIFRRPSKASILEGKPVVENIHDETA